MVQTIARLRLLAEGKQDEVRRHLFYTLLSLHLVPQQPAEWLDKQPADDVYIKTQINSTYEHRLSIRRNI